MIALVTGATGFVGRNVVKALCARGMQVRCLIHHPGREAVMADQDVDVHYGSIGDPEALRAAFYNLDVVVHLVAVIRESGKATFHEVNLRGTENVVAVAKQEGVKHLVYVSAIGAAADTRYPYLYSKWKAEQAVTGSGLPYTILRPSVLFGEGDEFTNTLAGLVRAFPVVPIAGSGKNRFQPIAVDELARCVAEAAGNAEMMDSTIEVGGPDHLSYNDVVDIIAQTYGLRRLQLHIPVPIMRPVVKLMETLLPKSPVTAGQLRMLPVENITQLNAVREVFGFDPRPLQGNIEYIKGIGALDGLRIAIGLMPKHIRDH